MCRECDDYPQPTPIVEEALAEIIGLNAELRKLRADTEATIAARKIQYESHVRTLNVIIADKNQEIDILRERVVKLTPPLVMRHVAEEMGLREGMATASGLVAEKEPDQK